MDLFKSNVFLHQIDQSMDMSFLAKYDKLIVETGLWRWKIAISIVEKDENGNTFYLGIEIYPSEVQ